MRRRVRGLLTNLAIMGGAPLKAKDGKALERLLSTLSPTAVTSLHVRGEVKLPQLEAVLCSLPSVTHLRLEVVHATEAMGALLRAPCLPSLLSLDLSRASLAAEGNATVASVVKAAPKLEELVLAMTSQGPGGVAVLCQAMVEAGPALQLHKLDLRDSGIDDAAVTLLAGALGSGAAPRLQCLDLSINKLADHGVAILAGLLGGAARQLEVRCGC
jgi:hypothetical protein